MRVKLRQGHRNAKLDCTDIKVVRAINQLKARDAFKSLALVIYVNFTMFEFQTRVTFNCSLS